jgi:hypothetical protein
VQNWFDCGRKENILESNATMLKKFGGVISEEHDFENVISIFDEGEVKFNKKYNIGDDKNIDKYKNKKDYINIKFEFPMKNLIGNFRVIFYK